MDSRAVLANFGKLQDVINHLLTSQRELTARANKAEATAAATALLRQTLEEQQAALGSHERATAEQIASLQQDVASASVALKVQGAAAAAMEGSSRQVRDQIAQLWVRSGEIERELPKLRREVADTQLRVDSRFASVGLNGSAVLGPTNFRGRIVIVGAGVISSVAASMLGAVTDVRAMLPVKRVVQRTETTFRASFLVDTGLPGTYFTQTTIDALGLNVADNQSVFW